jgi:Mn2+/Fe2+ NRAMP family transporter
VGAERSVSASLRQAPLFYGLFTIQLVGGAALAVALGNRVSLVVSMQVLNGLITPVLLTFVLTLANRRSVVDLG